MRTLQQHQRELDALLAPRFATLAARVEVLGIDDPALCGRVASTAVVAASDAPSFDNSQMDGYAVRVADLAGLAAPADRSGSSGSSGAACSSDASDASDAEPAQVTLPVGAATAAGDPPLPLVPGHAHPVMTGAAIPHGADAVIPIEQADPPAFPELERPGGSVIAASGSATATVTGFATATGSDTAGTSASATAAVTAASPSTVAFAELPPIGQFIRRQGSDVARGSELVAAGTRLAPAHIGLLAATGVAEVGVRPRPRVLLITTGDELAVPGQARGAGQIFDANTPMLAALLREAGAAVTARRVSDDAAALRELLRTESPRHDLIVTSGGISAGAFEVVRLAGAEFGVQFGSIALQPGGPQGWGEIHHRSGTTPIICMPGNPVSSALSLELFVLPQLRAHAGRPAQRQIAQAPLAHAVTSPPQKHQVRRGRFTPDGRIELFGPGSHLLADLARAELLAHLPVGVASLAAGDPVEIWRIDD